MDLPKLEARARLLGEMLHRGCIDTKTKPPKMECGFVLFLMDFGAGGHLTYISNIEREAMIVTIESWLAGIKANFVAEHVKPGVKTELPGDAEQGFHTPEDRFRCALQDIQRLVEGADGNAESCNAVCNRAHTIARLAVLGQDWERVPM